MYNDDEISSWVMRHIQSSPEYAALEKSGLEEKKKLILEHLVNFNRTVCDDNGAIYEGLPSLVPDEVSGLEDAENIYLSYGSNLRVLNPTYHTLMPAPTYYVLVGMRPLITRACFYAIDHIQGMGVPFDLRGDYFRILHLMGNGENDNLQNFFNHITQQAFIVMDEDQAIFE